MSHEGILELSVLDAASLYRSSMRACAQPRPTLGDPMDWGPLSVGFSRQEYWSGLPSPLLGGLPDPGIEPLTLASPALEVDSLPLHHLGIHSSMKFL